MTTPSIERRRGGWRTLLALAAPGLVSATTLVLTLMLAFESSQLHGADQALREYEALEGEHAQDKLYQAWKKIHFERVLKIPGPPLTQLDEYQKLAEAARELGDRRGALRELMREAAEVRFAPKDVTAAWDAVLARLTLRVPVAPAAVVADLPFSDYQPGANDCEAPPLPARKGAPVRSDIESHVHALECFLQALKISPVDFGAPLWSELYATRSKVNLLVSWLLPGLYGLLGACVYLIRQMLRRDAAAAHSHAAAWLADLLRIPLGGLAGIIVGWFWVPNGSTVIAVSSLPFGIAFLAGYSTEGLFAMLDRLVGQLRLGGVRRTRAAKVAPAA